MRSVGHVARMESIKNAYKILAAMFDRKKPLGRSRDGREDNIKENIKEMDFEGTYQIRLTQDRAR